MFAEIADFYRLFNINIVVCRKVLGNNVFELIKNKIKTDIIAVGVSGGADSLALALMLNDECKTYGIKVVKFALFTC